MQTTVLQVEGMSCSHCENAIKKSVGELDGVAKVGVDLSAKTVTIEYDDTKVTLGDIKLTIDDQGYDVL